MHSPLPLARRSAVTLGAAALLVAGLTVATGADAATPGSGTVSPTAPSLTYSSGPFLVSNVTGTAGAVDCSAPMSCDDFSLRVDTPAGYGTDHRLKVSVAWANAVADFDLYLLDSSGRQVAAAASSADPEVVLADPTPGTYTVRVVPYTVAGDSFTTTVSLPGTPPAAHALDGPGHGLRQLRGA